MKYKLDKITVTEVEVEIPDKCPGCGADFTDEKDDNLEVQGWMAVAWSAFIDGDGELDVMRGDQTQVACDRYEDTVMCRRCDHVIAEV